MFWKILSPEGSNRPAGKLGEAISNSFYSYESFKETFAEVAGSQFGSGWAWLVVTDASELANPSTPNQNSPLMDVADIRGTPILGLDVWKHACYLNYKIKKTVTMSVHLQAYFDRIGFEGTQTATLDTLQELHAKHPQAIPFENLNPLLGLPVLLDITSLQQKMVYNNQGGYCFEHNLLFREILETMGYSVKSLAARVRWNKKDDEITPRSHMLLLVEVKGKEYIADVGFGGSTLSAPLLLEPDTIQQTPHESYRLKRKNEEYLLQIQLDEWKALYQFTLQEQYMIDYKLANWYVSTHPESHFVNDLMAARAASGKRYILSNNVFKIHHLNGETEQQELNTMDELREVLENKFLLMLSNVLEDDKILRKLIS